MEIDGCGGIGPNARPKLVCKIVGESPWCRCTSMMALIELMITECGEM